MGRTERRIEMFTKQDLLFTENFRCQVWKQYFFPAGTKIADIADQINYPKNRLATALKNNRSRFCEFDISYGVPVCY
jgi:hypothetical protein